MNLSDLKSYKVVSQGVTAPTAPTDNRDLLQKTTDVVNKVFPGGTIGKAAGSAGYDLYKYITTGDSKYLAEDTNAPGPLQVAGDAANVVLTAGSLLTGGGAKALVSGGKSVAGRIGTNAAIGAGLGGTSSIARGDSASDVLANTVAGGVAGGVVGGVAEGAVAALEKVKGLPERLIRSATGQSKKELLAGKDVSKYLIENRRIGTADSILRKSQEAIDKANEIINTNLASVPVTKGKITTKSIVDTIVNNINSSGGAITKKEAMGVIYSLAPQAKGLLAKPSMSLVTANKLRQSLDKTLGDKGFLTSQLPFNKEVLRSFTNALRETVKTKAPEGTRAAFNTLSKEITLTKALENKLAQGSRNQIISFGDLFGAIPGGLIGGAPGAIAGAAARRAIQSTPVLTGSAVAIDSLSKKLSPVLATLDPVARVAITKALAEFIRVNTQSKK